jgi:hypothetical protein
MPEILCRICAVQVATGSFFSLPKNRGYVPWSGLLRKCPESTSEKSNSVKAPQCPESTTEKPNSVKAPHRDVLEWRENGVKVTVSGVQICIWGCHAQDKAGNKKTVIEQNRPTGLPGY